MVNGNLEERLEKLRITHAFEMSKTKFFTPEAKKELEVSFNSLKYPKNIDFEFSQDLHRNEIALEQLKSPTFSDEQFKPKYAPTSKDRSFVALIHVNDLARGFNEDWPVYFFSDVKTLQVYWNYRQVTSQRIIKSTNFVNHSLTFHSLP